MARRGSPIPLEERQFQDRQPEDFYHPDLNPFLKEHRAFGPPVLTAEQAAGRRGGWDQEFGREANTVCSKAGDVALSKIGLDLKVAIDRLREQVQNIE